MIRLISTNKVPEEEKKTVSNAAVNIPPVINPEDNKDNYLYTLKNIETGRYLMVDPVWRGDHLTAILDSKDNVIWEETYDWKLTDKYILEGKITNNI